MQHRYGWATHLAIEVDEVECEKADFDLDILNLYVFAFSLAELLEWHELAGGLVNSDSLRVQYKRLCVLFDALQRKYFYQPKINSMNKLTNRRQLLHQIRIFGLHIL